MSLTATTLYRIIPPLPTGQLRTITSDNTRPAAYLNGKGREHHQQRILELIDECGAVDLLILRGELDLCRKSIVESLNRLEASGDIQRHEPEHAGVGQLNTWTRRP